MSGVAILAIVLLSPLVAWSCVFGTNDMKRVVKSITKCTAFSCLTLSLIVMGMGMIVAWVQVSK